jgi:hypothetical protein
LIYYLIYFYYLYIYPHHCPQQQQVEAPDNSGSTIYDKSLSFKQATMLKRKLYFIICEKEEGKERKRAAQDKTSVI